MTELETKLAEALQEQMKDSAECLCEACIKCKEALAAYDAVKAAKAPCPDCVEDVCFSLLHGHIK